METQAENEEKKKSEQSDFVELSFNFTFRGKPALEKKVLEKMTTDPLPQRSLCQALLFFVGSLYGLGLDDQISLTEMKIHKKEPKEPKEPPKNEDPKHGA